MPGLLAMDYGLEKTLYRLWPWDARPYREPGPCNGDVADSRAERVVYTDGKQLLFVGRSDGGNGAYYCQDRNVNETTNMVSYDDFTSAYNMQSQAISYFAQLDAVSGQVLVGQYNLVRLSNTAGNTLGTVAIDAAGDNIYLAQTAACCIENMANLTVNNQALSGPADAAVLQVRHPEIPGSLAEVCVVERVSVIVSVTRDLGGDTCVRWH
jgi:hypothetical protein